MIHLKVVIDLVTACLALAAGFSWLRAAKAPQQLWGTILPHEIGAAMEIDEAIRKASWWNQIAAYFACASALCSATSWFFSAYLGVG
jgi:hypothetical protein